VGSDSLLRIFFITRALIWDPLPHYTQVLHSSLGIEQLV